MVNCYYSKELPEFNFKLLIKNIFLFSAWIELGCLKPYFQFKDTLSYSCKTTHFKEACKAIEEHIEENNTDQVSSFINFLWYCYFN